MDRIKNQILEREGYEAPPFPVSRRPSHRAVHARAGGMKGTRSIPFRQTSTRLRLHSPSLLVPQVTTHSHTLAREVLREGTGLIEFTRKVRKKVFLTLHGFHDVPERPARLRFCFSYDLFVVPGSSRGRETGSILDPASRYFFLGEPYLSFRGDTDSGASLSFLGEDVFSDT